MGLHINKDFPDLDYNSESEFSRQDGCLALASRHYAYATCKNYDWLYVIQALFEAGAKPEDLHSDFQSIVLTKIKEADLDELSQLGKLGISFTQIDEEDGWNLLHTLAYRNYIDNNIFKYLMELGNDVNALTADGKNMIDLYGEGLEDKIGKDTEDADVEVAL